MDFRSSLHFDDLNCIRRTFWNWSNHRNILSKIWVFLKQRNLVGLHMLIDISSKKSLILLNLFDFLAFFSSLCQDKYLFCKAKPLFIWLNEIHFGALCKFFEMRLQIFNVDPEFFVLILYLFHFEEMATILFATAFTRWSGAIIKDLLQSANLFNWLIIFERWVRAFHMLR